MDIDFFSFGQRPRPDSSKYGHKEIKDALFNISFYSEEKFANSSEAQIDHYIEVAVDKK